MNSGYNIAFTICSGSFLDKNFSTFQVQDRLGLHNMVDGFYDYF